MDIPDIVVISLKLNDIAGDVVIGKLKRIEKTKDIKYVLYTFQSGDKANVTQRISQKEGIDQFVEVSSVNAILDTVDVLFQ